MIQMQWFYHWSRVGTLVYYTIMVQCTAMIFLLLIFTIHYSADSHWPSASLGEKLAELRQNERKINSVWCDAFSQALNDSNDDQADWYVLNDLGANDQSIEPPLM